MSRIKTYFILLIFVAILESHQCRRSGGGSRSSSRSGSSRPSHSNPSYNKPSNPPSYNSPSYTRPIVVVRPRVASKPKPTSRSNPVSTARPSSSSKWNDVPPRPGRYPQGPAHGTYNTGGSSQKVKIVNKYNYHYPGYYSLPVAHHGYPGYYYTPSHYHYSSHDTGHSALGFYLGYSFGRLTTPTYSHYSFYDGYRPRYDHYNVHHYYHNNENVPKQQEIRSNNIIGCIGDSATICPANTTSLCTSTGALMCVVVATATTPCLNNVEANCISSTIKCVNNTAPECENSISGTATINIPCLSNAQIYGDLETVNNTIIPANSTLLPFSSNNSSTMVPTTIANATALLNVTINDSIGIANATADDTLSYIANPNTIQPPSGPPRKKRDVPQNYCVTILALPAKKEATEGEQFFNDAKFIVNKFFEHSFT